MDGFYKLQLKYYNKPIFLAVISLMIILIICVKFKLLPLPSGPFFHIIALTIATNHVDGKISIFKQNHFFKTLVVMPIPRQKIVSGIFIFQALYVFLIYLIFIPFLWYFKENSDEFITFGMVQYLGFFTVSLLAVAYMLYKYFQNPASDKVRGSSFGFLYSFILLMVHLILTSIEHEPTFIARLAIVPIISIYLYYHFYKKAVVAFMKKDVL